MRVGAIVEGVLRDHPDTRNSDKELLIITWERLGFFMSESQKAKFRDMPASETIRRVRQKLQEQGRFQAAEPIKRHRHIKGQVVQQRMPTTKPERVERLLDEPVDPIPKPEQSKLL